MVLGEALVIGIIGGALGTLLARGLIGNIDKLGFQLPAMNLDPVLMTGMFGFGAMIGLLSGLAPAIGAYRANITSMLRQV